MPTSPTSQTACSSSILCRPRAALTPRLLFFSRYVFDNYTWDKTSDDFSSFNGKPIPARVPLTALLSGTSSLCICVHLITSAPGPVAGDPFPTHASSPPAVIPEFFDEVCPERTVIDCEAVNAPLSRASAATILQAWLNLLDRTDDRCVEVKEFSGQIFDFWCVGASFYFI